MGQRRGSGLAFCLQRYVRDRETGDPLLARVNALFTDRQTRRGCRTQLSLPMFSRTYASTLGVSCGRLITILLSKKDNLPSIARGSCNVGSRPWPPRLWTSVRTKTKVCAAAHPATRAPTFGSRHDCSRALSFDVLRTCMRPRRDAGAGRAGFVVAGVLEPGRPASTALQLSQAGHRPGRGEVNRDLREILRVEMGQHLLLRRLPAVGLCRP
jgi:hypothetical protein